MTVGLAILIDLQVFVICSFLLFRVGRLAHSHPAIPYLAFHLLVVSLRLLSVWAGAPTLFDWGYPQFEIVTYDEIIRASLLFDLVLAVMTVGWILAARIKTKKNSAAAHASHEPPVTLIKQYVWWVALISFIVGVVGLLLLGNIPGMGRQEVELGEWSTSSWLSITVTWTGLALLALIYLYGLRMWLALPMSIYLALMAVQGFHRFRVVVPAILITQIYLDRRRLRWPSPTVAVVMVLLLLLFFPMKRVGRMVQEGARFDEITSSFSEVTDEAMSGQHPDQQALDQVAASLTLTDRAGKFYYGVTYLPLLVSPIPRQWWPDKPGLAEHIRDISTPERPLFAMGMVIGFIGDLYINFWYLGVLLIPGVFAYALGRMYFSAYQSHYLSVQRFAYLLIACNLMQIYRDGLLSIIVFTFVNMMPLAVIILLHYLGPLSPEGRGMRLPAPKRAPLR